ncbi:MAG: hypothetical protein KatS3mg059_1574 [Thermomicrobiales bacterium]|nr:MAG: hypothetical protein KatS3mg059_1574 [Thermomicrobiales bacterium]
MRALDDDADASHPQDIGDRVPEAACEQHAGHQGQENGGGDSEGAATSD